VSTHLETAVNSVTVAAAYQRVDVSPPSSLTRLSDLRRKRHFSQPARSEPDGVAVASWRSRRAHLDRHKCCELQRSYLLPGMRKSVHVDGCSGYLNGAGAEVSQLLTLSDEGFHRGNRALLERARHHVATSRSREQSLTKDRVRFCSSYIDRVEEVR
jgi:hypothetical protein